MGKWCFSTLIVYKMHWSSFSWLLMHVLQIDELLKQRNEIHASYTSAPPMKRSRSKSRGSFKEAKEDGQVKDKKSTTRDRPKKKKWYNIHLKVDKRKPCWRGWELWHILSLLSVFPFWQWFTVEINYSDVTGKLNQVVCTHFFCCNRLASCEKSRRLSIAATECWSMMILVECFHFSSMLRMTTSHCYCRIFFFPLALVILLFFFVSIFDQHTCKLHNFIHEVQFNNL